MMQRMSRLFGGTIREVPTAVDAPGQQWLVRAGVMRQAAAGRMLLLPLGQRVLERLAALLIEGLAEAGVQPVQLPQTLTQQQIVQLIAKDVRSYRQLPLVLAQRRQRLRDDVRARGGLLRLREYQTLDLYGLAADAAWADLLQQHLEQLIAAVVQVCGLSTFDAQADVRQLIWPTLLLGDAWLECSHCATRTDADVARFERQPQRLTPPLALEKIATPATPTIEALAQFLDVPTTQTGKAMMLTARFGTAEAAREQFVFVVVRGDREVSLSKVRRLLAADELRPATAEEISAHGAVAGYAGPIGLQHALIVVDEEAALSPNLVMGANEAGYHLCNVNLLRDYLADHVGDICRARDGDRCLRCGTRYETVRALEIARLVRLPAEVVEQAAATYLNEQGSSQPLVLLQAQIGLERLLGCLAEAHHDERGLCWPITIAPYQVQLVALAAGAAQLVAQADALADALADAGIEVLYDDRDERAGVKFTDADLIGLPLRVTISSGSLAKGGVEIKARRAAETTIVALDQAVEQIAAVLTAEYEAAGIAAPFSG